jgi:hypothetical protein
VKQNDEEGNRMSFDEELQKPLKGAGVVLKGLDVVAVEELRKTLEKSLPPVVARQHMKKYGLPYSEGYMANLDSAQKGPSGAVKIGSRMCYVKGPLIEWIIARSTGR